jgi:hypothetical protein
MNHNYWRAINNTAKKVIENDASEEIYNKIGL